MIEKSLLLELGCSPARVLLFQPHLSKLAEKYEVNTPVRVAHFLAQVLHESGHLIYTKEIWGPTKQQKKYERNFNAPWNRDQLAFRLGNYIKGDGKRYMGRGLIQTTGRSNHIAVSEFSGVDYVENPQWLERPYDATLSAFFFWMRNKLNFVADKDSGAYHNLKSYNSALLAITKTVNGGYNGIADRSKILTKSTNAADKYFTSWERNPISGIFTKTRPIDGAGSAPHQTAMS